ncbi:ornithine cyclodeaminase [Methylobrevis pamukkalensis]|uniref:Ornithine cyclodeaminase n=1 Tax=Methylobrevis pamukkalensis TaxID=1439726 RepID=A0A1E3H5U0_9HYPH|nr:ornithine cyclodeaminase [Methylobrevis pamukkalensis]
MRVYSAEETAAALPYPALVAGLREIFAARVAAPLRHHHVMARRGEPDAVLLLMPAWQGAGQGAAGFGGVKIVNVTPGNAARALRR